MLRINADEKACTACQTLCEGENDRRARCCYDEKCRDATGMNYGRGSEWSFKASPGDLSTILPGYWRKPILRGTSRVEVSKIYVMELKVELSVCWIVKWFFTQFRFQFFSLLFNYWLLRMCVQNGKLESCSFSIPMILDEISTDRSTVCSFPSRARMKRKRSVQTTRN